MVLGTGCGPEVRFDAFPRLVAKSAHTEYGRGFGRRERRRLAGAPHRSATACRSARCGCISPPPPPSCGRDLLVAFSEFPRLARQHCAVVARAQLSRWEPGGSCECVRRLCHLLITGPRRRRGRRSRCRATRWRPAACSSVRAPPRSEVLRKFLRVYVFHVVVLRLRSAYQRRPARCRSANARNTFQSSAVIECSPARI